MTRLAARVLTAARDAGIDDRDPLWPVLQALVALALRLERRAAMWQPTSPTGSGSDPAPASWRQSMTRWPRRAWFVLALLSLSALGALAFMVGTAHERAAHRAVTPALAVAFAGSGAAGAAAWTSLMQGNDGAEALARCEPLPGDTGLPAWRWCHVTLRVPAP